MITTPKESKPIFNHPDAELLRIHTNALGTILYANQSFLQRTSLSINKVLQQSISSFLLIKDISFPLPDLEDPFTHTAAFEFDSINQSAGINFPPVKWTIVRTRNKENQKVEFHWLGTTPAAPVTEVNSHAALDVYRSLFNHSPQPMWIYNIRSLQFLDVNKAATDHYGYSREEFLRMTINDILPSKQNKELSAVIRALWGTSKTGNVVQTYQKKDNSAVFAEIQSYDFQYYHHDARLVIINDVTEKVKTNKILQESEARFRSMADTAPVMIWLSDENDKTTYVNKYWTDFTGVKATEAFGDGWNKVIHPDDRHIGVVEYKKGFEEKKPVSLVYRLKHRTGQYHWVLDNAVPRFLDDGTFLGYIGSVVDIHDRKLSEEKIRFQADLIENVSDVIISTDTTFNVVTWNKIAEKTYGIKTIDAIKKNIRDICSHDYVNSSQKEIFEGLRNKIKWTGEVIFRKENEELVYLLSTSTAITNESGTITGYLFVNSDITEKKNAEKTLKKSELFYKSLIGHSLDGISLTNALGIINFVAPSVTNILGYEPEELVHTNFFELAHPDDLDLAKEVFAKELHNKPREQYITIRLKNKNREWIWCAVRGHNLLLNEVVQSMVVYFSDDSRRKEIEHALKEGEQKFRNLAENAPTIIHRLDKTLRYIYCNPAYTKITGIPTEFIIGKSPAESGMGTEASLKFTQAARKVFRNKTIETIKIDLTGKNDSSWSFIVTIAPELNESGEVESLLAISSNITEMKQTQELLLSKEEELVQSHERFELATKASTDSIWEINMANGYVYLSIEFSHRFGYSSEELSGKDLQWYIERLHPEDRLSVISKAVQGFSVREKLWRDEFRLRCKDGAYKYVYNRAYIFYDENGKPYKAIGAIQDITDRKKAESQLIQKDILLAASAHAANELLTEPVVDAAIKKSLQIVGSASKVDRAYILQYLYNVEKDQHYYQQQQEWSSFNYETQLNNQELEYLDEKSYPEIFKQTKEGLPTDLLLKNIKSASLKKYFQRQQIKSLLLMPIFVQNNFWGVVVFDQCGYDRSWTSMELDILRVFSSNLAAVFERKEGERKLMESEVKFKSLFQNSLDVVYVLDKDGTIKYVTPSVEQVFGYRDQEVTGKNGFAFIHPDDLTRTKKLFEDLINNPSLNAVTDIRVKDKNDKWIWIEAKGINKFEDEIIRGAIVNFHDISDRKQSEQQLQGYSEHITNILNSITDGFIALDSNFNILWWNPIAEQLTGVKDVDVLGKNLWKALPGLKKTVAQEEYNKTISSKTGSAFELYISKLNRYFDVNAYPSQQGLFVYFKDITPRKNQEMLLSLEKEVLELNTNPSASLKNTVDYFLEGMEKLNPGMLCSVLLLDESGKQIKHLSAPSLPPAYTAAIDGLKVGPRNGSCGTAMYFHKTVIVTDVMTDPLWEDYKEVIEVYQLKACWSFPIVSSSNKVLGSFAGYYKANQAPTEEQLNFFNRVAALLGVIIENKQAEQKVSISNERYLLATKATNDAIWDYDIKSKKTYWGESFYTLFGYKADDTTNLRGFWETKIHPDEYKQVKDLYDNAIKNKERGVVNAEYHFLKADGKYALVADRAFIVYDNDGEPARLVGSMQDVTERRKLEQRLLKQEINKEKSIAQAVVDAQEKERAEIGKELHDNVNQILSTAKLYLELAKTDVKQKDELIKRSADSIFNAINEIRHISKALVPASVKDLGLIDSIKDLVESLRMTKALQVKFVHAGDFDNIISEKQKLMLFRIIQEQVNNVLKHAEAEQIIINLKLNDKIIVLSIEDNGKGFDLEKIKFKKGVGLSNIESRAHLFNGKVTIVTAPKKGCKLFIEIPIYNA